MLKHETGEKSINSFDSAPNPPVKHSSNPPTASESEVLTTQQSRVAGPGLTAVCLGPADIRAGSRVVGLSHALQGI